MTPEKMAADLATVNTCRDRMQEWLVQMAMLSRTSDAVDSDTAKAITALQAHAELMFDVYPTSGSDTRFELCGSIFAGIVTSGVGVVGALHGLDIGGPPTPMSVDRVLALSRLACVQDRVVWLSTLIATEVRHAGTEKAAT